MTPKPPRPRRHREAAGLPAASLFGPIPVARLDGAEDVRAARKDERRGHVDGYDAGERRMRGVDRDGRPRVKPERRRTRAGADLEQPLERQDLPTSGQSAGGPLELA